MKTIFLTAFVLISSVFYSNFYSQEGRYYDLVIDKLVMNQTPQSGTWLFCFQAKSESESEGVFQIPDRTYEGDGITIDVKLRLSDVTRGEKIMFQCRLDDDQADVCAESAEDKSSGAFLAKKSGAKQFSFDNWSYTVYWHLEAAE
ncbi:MULTISPECIES: hypothetical protein [unclassified Chryseobacterium]|uniref:hypothetical protein n=1 Tax=unclassified Chryseobacterium TaxID=2593645 RepID=UPI000D3C02A9|nr:MULTISPECIES: hypothetical protein [unclassified Chryseobacterium]PTT76558.1 hypothetical protein DBR25_05595 [Chryseobacterium sp. HMWF001]PVV55557.1 hypothetical protein DD829_13890 [Chryseobacterium sp. HMWF035]